MPAFAYPPSLAAAPGSYGFYTPDTAAAPGTPTNTGPDYAVFDASTGQYVSRKTRKPYTGTDPSTGLTFNNGAQQPTGAQKAAQAALQIDPNNPSQRYRPVNVVKQPDIAKAEGDLMKTFTDTANQSLKGFSDYLSSFKSDLANARTAGAAATDIAPTVNSLTQAQGAYTGDLSAANTAYQQALASGATNTRGVVQQAQSMLPQYNQAVSNIEGTQLGALQNLVAKYKGTTGTPMSLGSDEERLLTSEAARIAQPFELAKINRGYDILSGMALPVEQGIAGQNINYASNFLPSTAGAKYGSATTLATTIQTLKSQVANMSLQQAISYMQAAGIPPQIMQQVLSGQIGQAGALSSLESGANYQGLQDLLGVNVSTPTAIAPSLPGLPNYAPRPTAGTGTFGYPGNAPTNVTPGAPSGVLPPGAIDPSTGGYSYRGIPTAGTAAYTQWLAQQSALGRGPGTPPIYYPDMGSPEANLLADQG